MLIPAAPEPVPVLFFVSAVPLFLDSSKKLPRTNARPPSETLYPTTASTVACSELARVSTAPRSDTGTRTYPSVRDIPVAASRSQREITLPAQAERSGVSSVPYEVSIEKEGLLGTRVR